jgi:hypothetical protein
MKKKCHLKNPSIITILVVLLSASLGKYVEAINRNNQKSLPPLLRRQSPLVSLDGTAGSNREAALGIEKNVLTRDDVITGVSGGECYDSTSLLLAKVGVGAGKQTILLFFIAKTSNLFLLISQYSY